ncbi:flagellar protein FlgN [Undibacterium sp. RTI2.1]|uniref:flagella synthesis protein FlgN n=1 Tax=unclassified Undibacterium TaxID=2630295 RepID=UPI002AB55997|nr:MULTISPECIES: flagellar protein FlgN [unclassified Undibacterium]MDY7537993.1 flagellar protein FlgN [Undibacterium sp. 5I1]MEB0032028.1 flagellar protein FlgN [Undibacterium sp. RTI2.1]MEB0117224.1 flagellar protein FlgN [Undibacterium sp. RTI2.2]MEB0231083.1 flagellar protein FlgN [Undibacterium sp. 10I3]MEB0257518.1 flagellar protein FlgN [Undibacterium sp. 5I1]
MNLSSAKLLQLNQCLEDEVVEMTSLSELLKLEQAALVEARVNDLIDLTKNKSLIIAKVSELEKLRASSLKELGFTSDNSGMQALLEKAPAEVETSNYWKTLLTISEQAQENNRTNGILINRQFTRNQNALNILQQNNPAGSMYGPNGQSTVKNMTGRGVVAG